MPLAGAAASGALGRADLVVWADDRIHLLNSKHSRTFEPEELAGYRQQLTRYADALKASAQKPVEAWLVAARSGGWLKMPADTRRATMGKADPMPRWGTTRDENDGGADPPARHHQGAGQSGLRNSLVPVDLARHNSRPPSPDPRGARGIEGLDG